MTQTSTIKHTRTSQEEEIAADARELGREAAALSLHALRVSRLAAAVAQAQARRDGQRQAPRE